MKKLFLMLATTAAIFLLTGISFGQKVAEIELLNQTDQKPVASYGDAVNLFILQIGKKSSTFDKDSEILTSESIGLEGYTEESPLTKGMLSKMAAKYLNLSGSLMYIIFDSERYAFKTCIANGVFAENGSESDLLSGSAAIEVFSKISELKGEQK